MKKIEITLGGKKIQIDGDDCTILDYTMGMSALADGIRTMLIEGCGKSKNEADRIIFTVVEKTLHSKEHKVKVE